MEMQPCGHLSAYAREPRTQDSARGAAMQLDAEHRWACVRRVDREKAWSADRSEPHRRADEVDVSHHDGEMTFGSGNQTPLVLRNGRNGPDIHVARVIARRADRGRRRHSMLADDCSRCGRSIAPRRAERLRHWIGCGEQHEQKDKASDHGYSLIKRVMRSLT